MLLPVPIVKLNILNTLRERMGFLLQPCLQAWKQLNCSNNKQQQIITGNDRNRVIQNTDWKVNNEWQWKRYCVAVSKMLR